jgi:two-component system, NtrC family, nitrogen regulation sensor histidine kinase NtrY
MRRRYLYGSGIALLAILVTLLVWQVSFSFGEYGPVTVVQTSVFWAISTLIFILTVTLGFMLFRTGVKLYIQRQADREGSRIQTKLVAGALALSLLPVVFLVMFSYVILNRNVEKWFSRPAEGVRTNLVDVSRALTLEVHGRADSLARWLASREDVQNRTADFPALCRDERIAALEFAAPDGTTHAICPMAPGTSDVYTAHAQMGKGELLVSVRPAGDLQKAQGEIDRYMMEYGQLAAQKRNIRTLYLLFILAIALFILFLATWIALLLSRQISSPISALLVAAREVRKGNLSHRVNTRAIDELATLVRAFNEMMQELEANSRELESRRRFTEAILESIPTGVMSLSADGRVQRVNRALHGLFPTERIMQATHVRDLFPAEDAREILYLMKRARRTGVSASQIDLALPGQVLHLAVTVSALPGKEPDAPGFVVVLEDTSELLRAQKAAAWHEVARRIAHELKNPLTPIALSAERIGRILDRGISNDSVRVLRECARTISREVESVKMLADEFSQFSRFPAAKPVSTDLNDVVKNALALFLGRLEGVDLHVDLAPNLPLVQLDPEQFKRVVVNLVDNAAEAMQDAPVKRLFIRTSASSQVSGPTAGHESAPESLELLVADTGCGISAEDKEKLFLPYFSTKQRGTGLGLAIVSHILSEHRARIRVEDNRPVGARFYVDIPVAVAAETEVRV